MKKTIRDYELRNKKVLIRCDFNVPMKDGKIIDDTRIEESLKTINYAISEGAKVILLSHLGRVKEEADLKKNNLAPVAGRLSTLLGKEVIFVNTTRGPELEKKIEAMRMGDVLLIQNTRYEDLDGKKESSNDAELGKYWASLGDLFINDAFGTAHRAHASNVGIATHLPNGIGFLMEKELNALNGLMDPVHPFMILMGGAKVSDKVGVINHLVEKADAILIGGGMANTFLKAKGYSVGASFIEEDSLEFAKTLLEKYKEKILLPIDVNVTTEKTDTAVNRITPVETINENEMILDIGPASIAWFMEKLSSSKTIFWNGPFGVYEMPKYVVGTQKLLEGICSLNANTVLGGGDIVAAAAKFGYKEKVSHASTGGGATLEFLEGKELPGLAVIEEE